MTKAELERHGASSAELGSALVSTIQDGVLALQDERLVFANPVFARMLGGTVDALVGVHLQELVAAEDFPSAIDHHRRQVAGETVPAEYDTRLVHRVSQASVRVHLHLCRAQVRGQWASVGTAKDLTAQSAEENALRESEARLREFLEFLPETVFEMELSGRLTFANQTGIEKFGYTREDLERGLNGFDLVAPKDRVRAIQNAQRILAGGQGSLNQYVAVRRDGSTFPAAFCSAAVRRDGRVVGLLGLAVDLSERMRLEEQLRQAQRMEAVGTLAGGIAHEFNNLLLGIQGRVSLMLMELEDAAHSGEHLHEIESYVQSATELTHQLLGFAQARTQEVQAVDLNELVRRTVKMFGRTRKTLRIYTSYDAGLRPVVADSSQIEQVLVNLYLNAWQAMRRGGDVYVSTKHVLLADEEAQRVGLSPGEYARIAVADTGSGMDEATRQRIFDPFFSTQEQAEEGASGLGLSSAYATIASHRGAIVVDTEVGRGTRISVHLPTSTGEPQGEAPRRREPSGPRTIARGTGTILLVDDEDLVIRVGQKMLEKAGYDVLVARSGDAAVRMLTEHGDSVALVILDMVMPGLSGVETYERLREVNPKVKVLLSTGYSENEDVTAVLQNGGVGFIQKPFSAATLTHKVQQMLGAGTA